MPNDFPRKDPEFCSKIRDRIDKWQKYWTINRALYYEWVDFIMGDQWREDESKLFERYNKIPLMMNKCGVLMNHLMGDMISNTPMLQIQPEGDIPAETAQIRAALIKDISLNSDAKTVYQTAYGQAIVGGYGAYRIGTDYIDDFSVDQEIKFYEIEDPNHCYWDIAAKHKCKIDGMFAGFSTRISRQRFKDQYGKDIESQIGTTSLTENSTMAFADDDSISQIDDYERKPEKMMIYKLSNGETVTENELKGLNKEKVGGKRYIFKDNQPMTILGKRESMHYKIIHKQIAGDYILAESEFPSGFLPVVFVDQKSYFTKQGQQITRSFFKDVKDAQKFLNYLATQMAYLMKVSRYDQFMAPRKCVSSPDVAQMWRDPSVVQGALVYDETPSGLKPEQLVPPVLSPTFIQQYERTLMDIQSGSGLYNTQLGEMGNEVSGTAIDSRNQRGSKNTQISKNSLDIAIYAGGLIVNEMIPHVYDTERQVTLPTSESEAQPITLNQSVDEYGSATKNDMTKGRYKIRLKTGPSYEGQKEEGLMSLQSVLAADKSGQVFSMIADLYAENLPIDNNIEIRNRLRTLVPPDILEAGKTGKPLPPKQPQQDPNMVLAQLKQQEMQQKAQQAQMNYQAKLQELELKKQEIQRKAIETHQNMTMAFEKLEAEKQEAAAELQESINRAQAENTRVGADLQINHSQNLVKLLTHAGQIHHEKEMQMHEHRHQKSIQPTIRE